MFQYVLDEYSNYFIYYNNNNNNDDDNDDDNNYDYDIDYEGVCYGVIESDAYALSVGDWIDFNAQHLKEELVNVYGIRTSKNNATTFWTEGLGVVYILLIIGSVVFITGGLVQTIRIVRRKQ